MHRKRTEQVNELETLIWAILISWLVERTKPISNILVNVFLTSRDKGSRKETGVTRDNQQYEQ